MKEIEFTPNSVNTDKENRVLKALQGDYENCKAYNESWHTRIDKWINEYMSEPYGNEKKYKSQIVTKDIKKYSEWRQASILDPFISTPDIIKCNPTNLESRQLAKNAEMILNQQFCRQFSRYNFLKNALTVMDIEGTCIIKTGWEFLEEERDVVEKRLVPPMDQNGNLILDPMTGQPPVDENNQPVLQEIKVKVKKKVRVIDRPTAAVVRNKDIYIDPSCLGDYENMQFIIHQYETDLSTLKGDTRYKNVDKIKISSREDYDKDADYSYESSNYFEFADKPRAKILVREYWGNYDLDGDGIAEPIVCAWVDNIVIRLEANPYPDRKPPFIIVPMLPIPFQLTGESSSELLGDTQKLKTAIFRGFIDNMAASSNAQIGIVQGSLDEVNKKRFLEGKNFEMKQTATANSIYQGNFNQLPNSLFNILQLIDSEATQLTGVNTFGNNQTTNMIGDTPASNRGVLDGGNLRKLMIVKNISENLIKPLMRKWLEYDAELLPPETVVRSTKNEDEFEVIHRDDLYGSMDIDITISTNEDNASKARELAFLLQTIGPSEDPGIRKIIMSEIMKLHKLYDCAHMIERYEPQPDPMQQEMMMAQIENLKAQTQELMASAGRQQVDGSLKEAKIPVEQAKAQALGKQSNLKSLEFYQKQNRFDQMQNAALKEKEIDEKAKNDRIKLQLEALDKIFKIEGEKARQGQPSIYSPITNDNRPKGKTEYSPSSEPNTARRLNN